MTRPYPTFTILRRGRTYAIASDSPAAAETDGVVMSGLDKADVLKIVEKLRRRGRTVNTEVLNAPL